MYNISAIHFKQLLEGASWPLAMRNHPPKKLLAVILILIFSLAFFVRFYKLGQIPNGLSVDEADLGYNTYSIIKTGKDIYGRKLPLFFQSLDDYKPGLVFYTSIPAIAIIGLSDFSIRLAPAVFGSLTIFLVYLIMSSLYPKNYYLAYVTTLLISFAPWHIALSRAMIWYIELLFLYLMFFICFLAAQKEHLKTQTRLITLSASSLFLSLTLYVYYAAIIYLPLILIVTVALYRQFFKKNLKSSLVALSILMIFSLPSFIHYASTESKTRLNAISVLTPDITLPTSIDEIRQDKQQDQPFSQFIHNRRLVYTSAFLDNYFDYFNLDYLFTNSKNIRYFYVNNIGLFYLVELPFFLWGLFTLIRRREKSDLLILSLFIIGPIPAMFTLGSPFPHRGILMIFAIQLISAVGVTNLVQYLTQKRFKFKKYAYRALAILLVFYFSNVYFFMHQYFVHSKNEFTSEIDNGAWYSTVRDAIPQVNLYKDKYKRIIFTWYAAKLVPGIYYLFYNQVDPHILQAKSSLWTDKPPSYRQIYNQIFNIEFRPINWEQDKNLKNTLIIGHQDEFPDNVENIIVKTFLPNGKPHFLMVATESL